MFQIYRLERPDMSPEIVAVDLRTDLVSIEANGDGKWLGLTIYSQRNQDKPDFKRSYGSFKKAYIVSPDREKCPLCEGTKRVGVEMAGCLVQVPLNPRRLPSNVEKVIDCPICTPKVKVYDLPQPLGAAISKAFGETDCADLYEGDPVAMVQVTGQRLRDTKQRLAERTKKAEEARALLA